MYQNRTNQVGDDFTVRRTNNSGTSWQSVAPSTLASVASNFDLHLVQTVNYNDAYVLGAAGAARVDQQAVATKVASFPTDIIASHANAAQLVALKDNGTIYRYTIASSGLTAAGTMTNTSVPLTCVALQGPNHVMAGGTNIFKYFNNTNTEVSYSGNSITGNILAIDVKNANAVMVGENGVYYRMKSTGANANGVLTGVNWIAIAGLANEDQIITALSDADLTTVAIASTTQIVYGGQYDPTFISSLTNPVEVPWVRSAFDPGERYSSRFYYDKLGRLIVSENARQYNGNDRKFSYTLYDELGRVIEVGEKTENSDFVFRDVFGSMVSGHYNPRVIDNAKLDAWINGDGIRQEVTRSYYDVFNTTFYTPPYAVNQDNQRKRIAHVAYYSAFPFDDQNNPIAFEEYDHATHFVYDIHGNVTKLMQDNRKMAVEFPTLADNQVKLMEYSYDLVSGNVHRMSVQSGESDQWHHAYSYDADNRITAVHTSTQTPIIDISMPAQFLVNELTENSDWTVEAKYFYYAHGPLARTELGSQLQGLDYIYNLQGWLKGVNATSLNNDFDPGADGSGLFSKDVMAFSLHYYEGDYTPIGGTSITPAMGIDYTNTTLNSGVGNALNLYNGNIRFMQTTLTDIPTGDALPMLNAYKYDQLNRLLEARSYTDGLSSNIWNPTTYDDKYFNTFTYDANGNILTQKRHNSGGDIWEDLTYNYLVDGNGNLLRNRLYHVRDYAGVTSPTYNNPSGNMSSQMDANNSDLDDQGQFIDASIFEVENDNNYKYDEEGRLIQDLAEGIEEIVWRVDGKVKKVIFTSASGKNNLEFDYDAFGRRIAKHVLTQGNVLVKSTYYILDAQGNQLSTYEHVLEDEESNYELAERVMYGSSRLGININKVDLFGNSEEDYLNLTLGNKLFEMSNHLGNVLTVINDIKVPYLYGSDVAYLATIVSTADYSPFGVQLDGRTVSAESYRYGFQGQEKDDEIKGAGNSVNYTYRMHDPRLGRFFAIDPLSSKYPYYSPYAFSGNRVIDARELEGLEPFHIINGVQGLNNVIFNLGTPHENGAITFITNSNVIQRDMTINERTAMNNAMVVLILQQIKNQQMTPTMNGQNASFIWENVGPRSYPDSNGKLHYINSTTLRDLNNLSGLGRTASNGNIIPPIIDNGQTIVNGVPRILTMNCDAPNTVSLSVTGTSTNVAPGTEAGRTSFPVAGGATSIRISINPGQFVEDFQIQLVDGTVIANIPGTSLIANQNNFFTVNIPADNRELVLVASNNASATNNAGIFSVVISSSGPDSNAVTTNANVNTTGALNVVINKITVSMISQ